MTVIERLRDKANSLPECAGVYIMKDSDGRIIYVGKSKKLKNRVTSYFVGSSHSYKTAKMVSLVRDFDYILCDTEIEALTLENTLIKKHAPRYNVKLKDAKSYPYIKVTKEAYPKLFVTRDRRADGRYFGPYSSSAAAHSALDTVMKIFSLPTCTRSFPRDIGRERPCIYRDMGRCVAPCVAGSISEEDYRFLVKKAEWVLSGNIKGARATLECEMQDAAENLEFERAAGIRDSIRALEKLSEKQKVVSDERVNRDVFSIYTSMTEGAMAVLSIRDGSLVNKNEFILSLSELTSPEDALSLVVDYYDTTGNIPKEVVLDFPISEEDLALLSDYLSIDAERRVSIRIPERGEAKRLCEMARENAAEAAKQHRLTAEREDKNVKRLSELLGLGEVPKRIEAYDISNVGDECITASMVVYEDGRLKKSDYRTFTVKTLKTRDDYASMREVLSRRLKHIGDGTPSLGERPDVIFLDGGAGHVGVVRELMREYGEQIPLFGMVKDDYHKTRALTDEHTEISIAREVNVYGFIYNLQEEAHRFAFKGSSGAKRRSLTHSTLERISGIGPKKAKLLLKAKTISEIRRMSVAELERIEGISRKNAEDIYAYYHK